MSRFVSRRSLWPVLPLLLALLLGGGCLFDEDEDDSEPTPGPLEGTWSVQENATSDQFGCTGTFNYNMVITSTGSGLQVTYHGKGPYALSVNGDSFSWTESHTSDLGGYTLTRTGQFTLTRDPADDTLSGQGSFTGVFSNDIPDCTGQSSFTGQRAG